MESGGFSAFVIIGNLEPFLREKWNIHLHDTTCSHPNCIRMTECNAYLNLTPPSLSRRSASAVPRRPPPQLTIHEDLFIVDLNAYRPNRDFKIL
jgi:hypothetical protein